MPRKKIIKQELVDTGKVVGGICFGIICSPCLVLLLCYCIIRPPSLCGYRSRKPRATDREEPVYEPSARSLPAERPRRLTNQTSQLPQLQSSLLTDLPTEVRLMIWQHVLGCAPNVRGEPTRLHVDVGDGILRFVRCCEPPEIIVDSNSADDSHKCWDWHTSKGMNEWRMEHNRDNAYYGPWRLNPLLLCCKLM